MHRFSFPLVALLSSALLASIFLLLLVLNWQQQRDGLVGDLQRESEVMRTTFEIALSDLEQQMLGLATMIALDPQVQELFWLGRQALEREGGVTGGEDSQRLREQLYQRMAPIWEQMQHEFGLRQLQFHLGPGSLSYLRVHLPERHGDRMDGLRHIIEDVNRDRSPRSGFETGRVYSGVRGVVPVWHQDAEGQRQYVGALEVGTSFDVQLGRLDQQLGAGFAVVLRQQHVEAAVWDAFRGWSGLRAEAGCECYLEAHSRSEVIAWMEQGVLLPLSDESTQSLLLEWEGETWHLTRFPLRDYLGRVDDSRLHVGSILLWRDKTDFIANWNAQRWRNALALLLLYLVTQLALVVILRNGRRSLQQRIDTAVTALQEREAMLQQAQSVANMGSWQLFYPRGELVWSPQTRRIFGVAADRPADYDLFLSLVHPDDRPHVDAVWRAALRGAPYDIEHRILVNGEIRWVREQAELAFDGDGQLNGAIGTVQDISDLKEAELALRASEERYRTTFAAIKDGMWDWDVPSGTVQWDERCYHMLGYRAGEFELDLETWQRMIHPDDVQQAYQEVERQLAQGETFIIEFRYRCADGSWLWVQGRGNVVAWERGQPLRVVGTHTDIAARKAVEAALQQMAKKNALLLNAAGEGIYGVDMNGRTTFINPAALAMLGYQEADILGKDQHQIFHHSRPDGSAYAHQDCPVAHTLRDRQERRLDDEWFIRKDGRFFPVSLIVTPLDEGDESHGAVVLFQDISERKEREQELHRLATTDTLTGLPNRRHFLERLAQEIERFQRQHKGAALLMVDIDHFKRVNDSHGHAVGDAVLRQFATLLQQSLRKPDLAGRLGGEEFAILLPGTDLDGALVYAERLRERIASSPCEDEGLSIGYTISIGVSIFRAEDESGDQPLSRADAGLYAAKQKGRNRVEFLE